jgi:5-methylcytosine-specific restriction endonuclease McrA
VPRRADTYRKDTAQAQFYGSTGWKRLREYVRGQEPVCQLCGRRPSTNVDHIDGDWRNNSRANLRALCTPCERSHTARQHGAKARGRTARSIGCKADGTPLDASHPWNR